MEKAKSAVEEYAGMLLDDVAKEVALSSAVSKLVSEGGRVFDFVRELQKTEDLTTEAWFKKTDPVPTEERLSAQVGVHLEECSELLEEFSTGSEAVDAKMLLAKTLLDEVGAYLKSGKSKVSILNRARFFDAVLDQRVTGTGVAHLAGFDLSEGIARVDVSNFTKFDEGKPVYKEGGKVAKGPYYVKPDLSGLEG